MENPIKRGILSIAVLVSLFGLLFSCATPALEDYRPKSAQEKDVLAVFTEMIEARKNQDFYEYMDFFRDDAKIFKRLHPGSNSGSFKPKKEYEESPGEEFGIQLNRLRWARIWQFWISGINKGKSGAIWNLRWKRKMVNGLWLNTIILPTEDKDLTIVPGSGFWVQRL